MAEGTQFIRCDGRYNIFRFCCASCGAHGEIHIPINGLMLFDHGCGSGLIFQQKTPRVGAPYLESIRIQEQGNA